MSTDEKFYDIIVIGAGLAGLCSAIHLQKCGWQVLVIEKDSFPRHKVCGEYISNEVRAYLCSLGFKPKSYGCDEISEFSLYAQNGKSLSHSLKMGGFGLSRYTMDAALYELAQKEGVEFVQDEALSVNKIVSTISGKNYYAKMILSAAGKRSKIDKNMDRQFMTERTSWMGVKAHYSGQWPKGKVALFQFDGGYCGVSCVEDNRVNVCYLVSSSQFKKAGNFEKLENKVMSLNPSFKSVLGQLERIMDRKVISQIYFGNKEKSKEEISFLGDAAGMIYPLAGNGMAMAIHSAKLSSELVDQHLKGNISKEDLSSLYTKKWNKRFSSRVTRSRMIQSLMEKPILSKIGMNVLSYLPFLLSHIIESTHGKDVGELKVVDKTVSHA